MDPVNTTEARDYLELVERVLAETQPRLCSGGEHFVVWGLVSAFVTVIGHLVGQGIAPQIALWCIPAALVAGAAFSILRGRYSQRVLLRSSLVQREFFNVLWVTLGLAFVVDVAVSRIFAGLAGAAIWSVAEAIVLLYIGMHGNRRAQVAGVLVVASLVAANFAAPAIDGYILAAGMLLGYGGFGIAELLTRG